MDWNATNVELTVNLARQIIREVSGWMESGHGCGRPNWCICLRTRSINAKFGTMDAPHQPLTTKRMLLGLTAAAAAGLAALIGITFASNLLQLAVATLVSNEEWRTPPVFQGVLLYAVLGFPLSLIFSVAIGLPVWKRAESRPLRSSGDAIALGANVGATIGLLLLTFSLVMGLRTYFDDNSSYNSWSWGYQVTKDGLPTLFGWLFKLLDVLYFILAGAAGGLAARWTALPKVERQ